MSVYSFQSTFQIDDILFHSEVIRHQVRSFPKSGPNFHVLGPQILRVRAPKFLTQFLKLHSIRNIRTSLVAIGQETSEITRQKRRNASSKTSRKGGHKKYRTSCGTKRNKPRPLLPPSE